MNMKMMGATETMMTLLEAVTTSVAVVEADQKSMAETVGFAKADGSEWTDTDKRSESAGCNILERLQLPIWTEERKRPKLLASTAKLVLYDPLDGTHYFRIGASGVTVIASILDRFGAVIACVVGEVGGLKRVFFASKGCGAWVFVSTGNLERDIESAQRCSVSKGDAKRKTISLDLTTGWKKEGYSAIADQVYGQLFARLFGPYKIQIGPNGINHALCAYGHGGVVGSITTSLGGPWDVAPVLLILEAGGFARGYRNGVAVDPLLVMDYNMLVTAATEDVLEDLSGRLVETCYPTI